MEERHVALTARSAVKAASQVRSHAVDDNLDGKLDDFDAKRLSSRVVQCHFKLCSLPIRRHISRTLKES